MAVKAPASLSELIRKLPEHDQRCLSSAVFQILKSREQKEPKKIVIHSDGARRLKLEYPTVEVYE